MDYVDAGYNQIAKECLDLYGYDKNLPVEIRFKDFEFNKASACASKRHFVEFTLPRMKQLESFLESNPEYLIPGGSNGNIDPCWGKNRLYHREGGC